MSSRVQATKIALGVNKQVDIATAVAQANMACFTKLNASLAQNNLGIETDEAEYGKGHEFATQAFAAGWDVAIPMQKYGTSQFAAWAWAFALGNVSASGSTYTITPIDSGAGLELPYASYVEQIPGTDDDQIAVGCAVEEITQTITIGPGRSNNRLDVNLVGSGKIIQPSGITVPSPLAETTLPAGIAAVTINGVDYVANKNIVSITQGWKNNLMLNEGFFPGSGFQTAGDATSGQVRGRIEIGTRVPTFNFVARVDSGSTEAAKLSARTTGSAVVSLPVSGTHFITFTWEKMLFQKVNRTDTNGIATITVSGKPMFDSVNGLLSISAGTDLSGICQ